MKQLIVLILAIILSVPNLTFAEQNYNYDAMTRAEFARVIVQLMRIEDMNITSGWVYSFPDVVGHYLYKYVRWLQLLGVVLGGGDNYFRPDDTILIEHATVMLLRVLGYQPIAIENGNFPIGYAFVSELSGLDKNSDSLLDLVNRALDIPMVGFNHGTWQWEILDGLDGRGFHTLRTRVWDNAPVYFDGENFILLEEVQP